ncbi:MAG: hypothetical protein MI922_07300, partial [Bacteroidales bacterium]|nr:hypothetical protein [Bacteroidales bacterium]
SWLKDYLYIPMGGNRSGSAFSFISLGVILLFFIFLSQNLILIPIIISSLIFIFILLRIAPSIKKHITTNINLLMTMLLGGLWHGANWTFVIWGGLNGIGIVVYKYWRRISPYEKSNHWIANTWKIFLTFTFITFTRIWFRGESMPQTMDMLSQIGTQFSWNLFPEIASSYWKVYSVMAFGLIVHWIPEKGKQMYRNWFMKRPMYQQIGIAVLVVFIIFQFVSADLQPFIYFQF